MGGFMKGLPLLFACAFCAISVNAATIHVPADQPTIQAGIDSAVAGDTVLVAGGTYTGDGNRDIGFGGKNIVLKSEDGPEFTIIDCQADTLDPHRGFSFMNGETAASVIEGFTIRNGYAPILIEAGFAWWYGGGIYCDHSSPTIRNCVFDSNYAIFGGGGMYCDTNAASVIENCEFRHNSSEWGGGASFRSSSAAVVDCVFEENSSILGGAMTIRSSSTLTLTGCRFEDNQAEVMGGGLFISGSSLSLTDCVFHGNSGSIGGLYITNSYCVATNCLLTGNRGGGIGGFQSFTSQASFVNCTISHNRSLGWGAGGFNLIKSSLSFTHCIISKNFSSFGDTSLSSDSESVAALTCCDVYGNTGGDWVGALEGQEGINGNFSILPFFCDASADDFHLMDISPCAPANNSCGVLIGALDVACNGPKAIVDPDTMYAFFVHTIDTMMATAHFGGFTDDHTVNDIDPSSVRVLVPITPTSWSILPSHPEFDGEVMEITFPIPDFIEVYELFYGPLWDTMTWVFPVSGLFSDSTNFEVLGLFTLIGHTSGDVNADGSVNIADITYLIDFLFSGGPEPPIMEVADLDCNGSVNVADITYLVEYLFFDGPAPKVGCANG
jgi:hypothetical protein